jgi:hypothetical protein
MRRVESWLTGLLWAAAALLLPMAALEPVSLAEPAPAAPSLALGACADGSAHLAMGCASIQL